VKETLAVAPNIRSVRLAAIREVPPSIHGDRRSECVLACMFERRSLVGVRWKEVPASQVVNEAASELLLNQKGRTKELQPLDLAHEPELKELLGRIELDDLDGR
jgi:hypothetical protein